MLTPLFSQGCELVGWMQPQKFLFDIDMAYVAFLANGHAWSARSGRWIGPVVASHVFDIEGRPVAWNPAAPLRGSGRPLRPVNVVRAVSPVRPAKPVAPMRPLTAPDLPGGWSQFSFAEWLVSSDPKPVEIVEDVVVEMVDEVTVVEVVEVINGGEGAVQGDGEPPRDEVK